MGRNRKSFDNALAVVLVINIRVAAIGSTSAAVGQLAAVRSANGESSYPIRCKISIENVMSCFTSELVCQYWVIIFIPHWGQGKYQEHTDLEERNTPA